MVTADDLGVQPLAFLGGQRLEHLSERRGGPRRAGRAQPPRITGRRPVLDPGERRAAEPARPVGNTVGQGVVIAERGGGLRAEEREYRGLLRTQRSELIGGNGCHRAKGKAVTCRHKLDATGT